MDIGLKMNPTSYNEKVVDNTLIAGMQSVASYGSRNMSGSQFIGNVFNNTLMIGGSVKMQGNVSHGDTSGVSSAGADIGGDVPAVADASHLANRLDRLGGAGTGRRARGHSIGRRARRRAQPGRGRRLRRPRPSRCKRTWTSSRPTERRYSDAAAAEGSRRAPGAAADEALLAADQAQLKADRGSRDLLKADRVQLAADRRQAPHRLGRRQGRARARPGRPPHRIKADRREARLRPPHAPQGEAVVRRRGRPGRRRGGALRMGSGAECRTTPPPVRRL